MIRNKKLMLLIGLIASIIALVLAQINIVSYGYFPTKNELALYGFKPTVGECNAMARFGVMTDGGWVLCIDNGLKQDDCIVYSFGINYEDSFDRSIASTLPNCKIYMFDPTNGWENTTFGRNRFFYSLGIRGFGGQLNVDLEKKCATIDDIMKELGHSHVNVIKMDVEESEWPVLEYMFQTKFFDRIMVNQMAIEFHFTANNIERQIELVSKLKEVGFKVLHNDVNWRNAGWIRFGLHWYRQYFEVTFVK